MAKEEVCCHCTELGRIVQRIDDGPVCYKCYALKQYYDPFNHKFCVVCRQHRFVARRTQAGDPVCGGCVRKVEEFHEQCFYCEENKPVYRRSAFGKKAICKECSAKGRGPRRKKQIRILRIPGITPKKDEFRRHAA